MARKNGFDKKTGSYNPSYNLKRMGAPTIHVSPEYPDPYAPKTMKVDVEMYIRSPYTFQVEEIKTIKGVSPNVAKKIGEEIANVISKGRSAEGMSKRVEYVSANYFSREYGRTAVLLENIANDAGLSLAFKNGMNGRLSEKAQADFQDLIEMMKEITKDKDVMQDFYEDAKKHFNILGHKYDRFKANSMKIDAKDKPNGFNATDVVEMEKAIAEITKIAHKYVDVIEGERIVGSGTRYRQLTLTGQSILKPR